MLNLSDSELDRLSREAAEQYEPDEQDSSWEKLEQLLDKEPGYEPPASPPPSQRFGMAPIFYSALFILLVGSAYFLIKYKKSSSSVSEGQENKTAQTQKVNPGGKSEQNNPSTPDRSDASADQRSAGNNANQSASAQAGNPAEKIDKLTDAANDHAAGKQDNIAAEKEKSNAGEASNNNPAESRTTDVKRNATSLAEQFNGVANVYKEKAGNKKAAGKYSYGRLNNKRFNKNKTVGNAGSQDSDNAGGTENLLPDRQDAATRSGNTARIPPPAAGIKWAQIPQASSLLDGISPAIDDSALRSFTVKTDSANSGITSPGKKNSRGLRVNRSLIIGAMLAPDLTNVNSSNYNKLSTSYGLTLGYQFANRWSVNTGLIYTSKNYTAYGYDFNPKQYNWKDIKGNCKMIEIPLTLRYDLSVGRNTAFFVNGGFSSYFMKREAYDYYWKDPQDPMSEWYYIHDKEFPEGKKNFWFSMANLSLGIEQYIGPGLSLQVEPFAKLPLSGVGWGRLQLSSYGVSFSLRYSPVLKRSRR